MPGYRLYRLDDAGKITTAERIDAAEDDEALQKARPRALAGKYELWDQRRLVARLSSDESA